MPGVTHHERSGAVQDTPIAVAPVPHSEERRASQRTPKNLMASVQSLGRGEVYNGPADDVSEGGLYVRVPLSQGLAVGQRCEVRLSDPAGSAQLGLAGEGCYATVVRTEVITSGSQKLLGAGMRFDQPLFL